MINKLLHFEREGELSCKFQMPHLFVAELEREND